MGDPRHGRRAPALVAVALLLGLTLALNPLVTSSGQAAVAPHGITLNPTSGLPNSSVSVSLFGPWPGDVGTTTFVPCSVTLTWNGQPWSTTPAAVQGLAGQSATGSVPAGAAVGSNTVTANCVDGNTGRLLSANSAIFTLNPVTWTLTDTPSTMVAGTSTVVLLTGANNAPGDPRCAGLQYYLDGHLLATQGAPYNYPLPSSTAVGSHTFKISCGTAPLNGSATATFTVTPRPTTTTTTRGTTTTTARGSTTTTAKGATTTTAKGATTTTGKGSSGSTSSSGSTTSVSIDSTPTTVPGEAPITSSTYLRLTALAIAPGASVSANGRGCDAGAPVALTIGSTSVGRTRASASGAFHAPLTLGPLGVGRYTVVARCGVILAAPLDIVLASQVSAATSTLAIIIFVLLIGALAFRRQIFPRQPRRAPSAPPPETESPT